MGLDVSVDGARRFLTHIIALKLCTNMRAEDVTDMLALALKASGCDSATVLNKPRVFSDNGPSYMASELAEYIEANKMSRDRGVPMHQHTQCKIDRWRQIPKSASCWKLLPARRLETQIKAFAEHYNHGRYHEAL